MAAESSKEPSKRMQRFKLQRGFEADVVAMTHLTEVFFNKLINERKHSGKPIELAVDVPTGDTELKGGRKIKVTETVTFDPDTFKAFLTKFKKSVYEYGRDYRELSKRTVDPEKVGGLAAPATYTKEWTAYIKAIIADKRNLIGVFTDEDRETLERGISSIMIARRVLQIDCEVNRPAGETKTYAVTPLMKKHLVSVIAALKADAVNVDAFKYPILSKIAGLCSIPKTKRTETEAEMLKKQEVIDSVLRIYDQIRKKDDEESSSHDQAHQASAAAELNDHDEESAAPAPVKKEPESVVAPEANGDGSSVRRPGRRVVNNK